MRIWDTTKVNYLKDIKNPEIKDLFIDEQAKYEAAMYRKMAIRKEGKGLEMPKEHFVDLEEVRTESVKAEEPTTDSSAGGIGIGTGTAASLTFDQITKLLKDAVSGNKDKIVKGVRPFDERGTTIYKWLENFDSKA